MRSRAAPTPAVVAIKGDASDPQLQAAVADLKQQAIASGKALQPIYSDTSPDGKVLRVASRSSAPARTRPRTTRSTRSATQILPATVGKVAGVEYAVTGDTASSKDWNDKMKSSAPLVFVFVLSFAFLLLLVSFRSIVIPVKAIVMNLLSVGAAYGLLVAVFQWGWGANLLDFQKNGGIASWLPMFLFVILFGLSMDYHVFILSRVKEYFDRGMSTEQAVEAGIRSTAGVVTSAAVVMVFVFGVFALMPIIDMKEMGIGLAAAVLIDATIVRAVLLPATMKLLGEWNWYLPTWLEWLPTLEHERSVDLPGDRRRAGGASPPEPTRSPAPRTKGPGDRRGPSSPCDAASVRNAPRERRSESAKPRISSQSRWSPAGIRLKGNGIFSGSITPPKIAVATGSRSG